MKWVFWTSVLNIENIHWYQRFAIGKVVKEIKTTISNFQVERNKIYSLDQNDQVYVLLHTKSGLQKIVAWHKRLKYPPSLKFVSHSFFDDITSKTTLA